MKLQYDEKEFHEVARRIITKFHGENGQD